jgi:hypothetical protein
MPGSIGGGNLPGNDMHRITLPDGQLATVMNSQAVDATVISVPTTVQYPDLRYAYPSGTLSQGTTITVSVTMTDSDGNDTTPDVSAWQMVLSDYTQDPTKEVLGVIYFNFTESLLPDTSSS